MWLALERPESPERVGRTGRVWCVGREWGHDLGDKGKEEWKEELYEGGPGGG